MQRKSKVGIFAVVILLSSASLAFASLAIFTLPQLPTLLPQPSNVLYLAPKKLSYQQSHKTMGSRYFLEYKTWRSIQASA